MFASLLRFVFNFNTVRITVEVEKIHLLNAIGLQSERASKYNGQHLSAKFFVFNLAKSQWRWISEDANNAFYYSYQWTKFINSNFCFRMRFCRHEIQSITALLRTNSKFVFKNLIYKSKFEWIRSNDEIENWNLTFVLTKQFNPLSNTVPVNNNFYDVTQTVFFCSFFLFFSSIWNLKQKRKRNVSVEIYYYFHNFTWSTIKIVTYKDGQHDHKKKMVNFILNCIQGI